MNPKNQALLKDVPYIGEDDIKRIERLEGMLVFLNSKRDEDYKKMGTLDSKAPTYRSELRVILDRLERRQKRYWNIDILLAGVLDRLRATRVRQ